jgi:hypothetical protein
MILSALLQPAAGFYPQTLLGNRSEGGHFNPINHGCGLLISSVIVEYYYSHPHLCRTSTFFKHIDLHP